MPQYQTPDNLDKSVKMIDELLTDAALNAFSEITVAQLLENPASVCETLALIQNIPKFSRNYKLTHEQVGEVLDIRERSELVARHAYSLAFYVVNSIKKARRAYLDSSNGELSPTMREEEQKVEQRAAPRLLPAKPQAQPFTPDKAKKAVEVFLNRKMKINEQTFTFEECCTHIKGSYLEDASKRWHDTDLVEVNNQTPRWKQSVSSALSFFSDKEMVSFVHRRNLWIIIPL